jgi:hypothetical protein
MPQACPLDFSYFLHMLAAGMRFRKVCGLRLKSSKQSHYATAAFTPQEIILVLICVRG